MPVENQGHQEPDDTPAEKPVEDQIVQPPPKFVIDNLTSREVSELYLLLDYISGRPDRQLAELEKSIVWKGQALSYSEIVTHISRIRNKINGGANLDDDDTSLVLLCKDRLNSAAYPAKGSTIAYTTLFSEARSETKGTERSRLSELAFPDLAASARRFRNQNRFVNWSTFVLAILSALALWQFTYGAKLAAQFDISRKEEREAAAKIYNYIDKKMPKSDKKYYTVNNLMKYCWFSQKEDAVKEYDAGAGVVPIDSEVRQLCNDYAFKNARYCVAISDLGQYREYWMFKAISTVLLPINIEGTPNKCGEDFETSKGAGTTAAPAGCAPPTPTPPPCGAAEAANSPSAAPRTSTSAPVTPPPGTVVAVGKQEDAQSVIAVLVMMINYILPMAFGFVGAAAALIRSVQDNVKSYTLSPRDQTLSIIRLMLGAIAGVCVGLFLTPASIAENNGTTSIGLFTLSASSVAFIAGYGADGFFRALDILISRIFDPDAKPQPVR